MNTKNYVTQKSALRISLVLSFAAVTFILFAFASSAQASCSVDKMTQLKNSSEALLERIEQDLSAGQASMKPVAYRPSAEKSDDRFYTADRSNEKLAALNSIGVVSPISKQNSKSVSYGSSILIDKCFVLTNRHVVKAIAAQQGHALKIGQVQNFSVGQSCQAGQNFLHSELKATLVDMGPSDNNILGDWAILKLEKPVSDINPAELLDSNVKSGSIAYAAGFPASSMNDKMGFQALRVQSTRILQNKGNYFNRPESSVGSHGISGGGTFAVSSKNGKVDLKLAGLNSAEDQIIDINHVVSELRKSSRKTLDDINKDRPTDSCL